MEIEESNDNSMLRDQWVGWWEGGEGEEDRGVELRCEPISFQFTSHVICHYLTPLSINHLPR